MEQTAEQAIDNSVREATVWEMLVSDDDVAEDFRALDIDIHAPLGSDQARRDAIASMLLRRQAEEIAAIAQLDDSRNAELVFVNSRYLSEIQRRERRSAQLERAVQALAKQTKDEQGYIGKKKSRDVGAGSYGYRTSAPCVELRDEAAYIAWAEANAPETLRVKPILTLSYAKEFLSETELATVRREVVKIAATSLAETLEATIALPPGFVRVDESHDFFAKPLPAAAIAGARV